jgi:thiol-disulfide isomerase/thioredoxin
MGEKIVSIARHSIFFKKFFQTHKSILENLTNLSFNSLELGYKNLLVFYGSYSYWIREDEDDTIKEDLLYNLNKLSSDKDYSLLCKKLSGGIGNFKYDELKQFNKMYLDNIIILFKTFETYCKRFAPNDMLPSLTENVSEYNRKIKYVEYDIFFDNFYSLQEVIHNRLLNFTILDFRELFTITTGFFYGYSYYLQPNTQKLIKDKFEELFEIYNNEDFLRPYFNVIQNKVSKSNAFKLIEYKEVLFSSCLEIFELINADLPKTNIMPKKNEKVLIDKWSI